MMFFKILLSVLLILPVAIFAATMYKGFNREMSKLNRRDKAAERARRIAELEEAERYGGRRYE